MTVHMENKAEGEDLGAYGSFFDRGYEHSPAPMPQFIINNAKCLKIKVELEDPPIKPEQAGIELHAIERCKFRYFFLRETNNSK